MTVQKFRLVPTKFSKTELFLCLPKVDHSTNAKGLLGLVGAFVQKDEDKVSKRISW